MIFVRSSHKKRVKLSRGHKLNVQTPLNGPSVVAIVAAL